MKKKNFGIRNAAVYPGAVYVSFPDWKAKTKRKRSVSGLRGANTNFQTPISFQSGVGIVSARTTSPWLPSSVHLS